MLIDTHHLPSVGRTEMINEKWAIYSDSVSVRALSTRPHEVQTPPPVTFTILITWQLAVYN
jgi:hypothetical protein